MALDHRDLTRLQVIVNKLRIQSRLPQHELLKMAVDLEIIVQRERWLLKEEQGGDCGRVPDGTGVRSGRNVRSGRDTTEQTTLGVEGVGEGNRKTGE